MTMPDVSAQTCIGWIGTGVMGSSMCGHLLSAGYPVTVFNRTKAKAEKLLADGAEWAPSPRDVAAASSIVFSIVGYPEDVREVVLGERGVLAGSKSGDILVDMTTSRPALAVEIFEKAAQQGVHAIDAPVSGGDIGAREARLSMMVGGESSAVEIVMPLLHRLGKTIIHQGSPGCGQHTKMVNQVLIATNMIGVCEALLYAYRAGLDLERVMESVASGAAGSWSLSNLGPRIIANNFEPGFFVDHFLKDMRIALEESERLGLDLPGLRLAAELYESLRSQGHAQAGTQALQLSLARLSGIDWTGRAGIDSAAAGKATSTSDPA